MKISRIWAMPNKWTFTIPAVKDLLLRYMNGGLWIDPFAGFNSPAGETNDLNPDSPAKYHLEATEFVKKYKHVDGVLFDPPYSARQIMESYKGIGLEVAASNTNASFYSSVKSNISVKTGGIAISFGWNSMGMGINRGFEAIEILLIAHGGAHNDTICTVERKIQAELF